MHKTEGEGDVEEFVSSDDDSSVLEDHDAALKSRILQVFRVFDQNKDNTIDVNDVANVYRCLLINFSEEQLTEIQSQLLKTDADTVQLEHLMPRLLSQLQNVSAKHRPVTDEALEAACRTLVDSTAPNDGSTSAGLTKERFIHLMSTRGEPLSDGEMLEMKSHLPVRRNGVVDWRSYIRDIKITVQEMSSSLKQKEAKDS